MKPITQKIEEILIELKTGQHNCQRDFVVLSEIARAAGELAEVVKSLDQHLCEQIIDPCGFDAKKLEHHELVQLVEANSDLNEVQLLKLRSTLEKFTKTIEGE